MANELSLFFGEELVPYVAISFATGFIKNVRKLDDGAFVFELWSEVSESIDERSQISFFEDLDKSFLVNRIFVFSNALLDDYYECLQEEKVVSVTYRSFLTSESGEFLDVAVKIEDANPEYEKFIVQKLINDSYGKASIERFWLNKIIRAFCFKEDFF